MSWLAIWILISFPVGFLAGRLLALSHAPDDGGHDDADRQGAAGSANSNHIGVN